VSHVADRAALDDRPSVLPALLRAAMAIAIVVAVAYQVGKDVGQAGFSVTDYFSYFTELSNLFAAAVLLCCALPRAERSRTVEMLRGASVTYMLTTGIVYAVLLSGHAQYPWVNTIVHRVSPVFVALDWIADPPRVRLELRRTIVWLAFPIVYIVYTLIRGAIVDWYPYFFVNPHHHGGYLFVAGGTIGVGAGIIALIAATTWVGNRRSERGSV
jgi:hypothetical protein